VSDDQPSGPRDALSVGSMLYLNGTRVTDSGLERLRRALPEVKINR
jgi:hypothetical protein